MFILCTEINDKTNVVNNDIQITMTTLLMLSQDSAVNTNIHGYVIASSSAVDWFRDGDKSLRLVDLDRK